MGYVIVPWRVCHFSLFTTWGFFSVPNPKKIHVWYLLSFAWCLSTNSRSLHHTLSFWSMLRLSWRFHTHKLVFSVDFVRITKRIRWTKCISYFHCCFGHWSITFPTLSVHTCKHTTNLRVKPWKKPSQTAESNWIPSKNWYWGIFGTHKMPYFGTRTYHKCHAENHHPSINKPNGG